MAGVLAVVDHLTEPLDTPDGRAAVVVRNELTIQDGLASLIQRAAAAGLVDVSVAPLTAASWIQGLVDGLFGRTSLDPSFDPREQVPVMKLILTRFLRPWVSTQPRQPPIESFPHLGPATAGCKSPAFHLLRAIAS
ncbi:hypothetical protein FKR81_35740 [Lentzea tibetensis]|uniref:Tetracyclin repressor-like C-terminal domain-containing protein n=1 Tax=Lentzea tibetensis TaxID=2591470 RepID=A0A563EIT4_9PSEU|nr:hypothetical protein [Lentzea tibetensis]TWP46516.1 hypothetical protein FKR81_35740 [Lentzea tibetensis]